MDEEVKKEFGKIWEKIKEIEKKFGSDTVLETDTKKPFVFSNKNKNHGELLEELLKSEYCHTKNGLLVDEILQVFSQNKRPVVSKKIKDLLAIWKIRRKIEAIKSEGGLQVFLDIIWKKKKTN